MNPTGPVRPRIVIHGGAGNLNRNNLSPPSRHAYLTSLSRILSTVHPQLLSGQLSALDAAVLAVQLLENDPLFNAGKGAVFTLDGTNELEASVMVSRGQHKRFASGILLKHVKNPVLFAKELLLRDDPSVERGRQHNCLSGEYAEKLAEKWGLEIVDQKYFFTETRWRQHLKDLERGKADGEKVFAEMYIGAGDDYDYDDKEEERKGGEKEEEPLIQLDEYLPKGTVGCVALDSNGVIAAATSTGGLTNKVPGRIGDTPTPGAGFWAEEWEVWKHQPRAESLLAACLPFASTPIKSRRHHRAVGLSGTGNGDYFLRLAACHNIASRCRFGGKSLKQAAREVCGRGGEMEEAGEGRNNADGAVIGIDEEGGVIMEMNCGGCFRGTVDLEGRVLVAAYADEPLEQWGTVKL
ncbi:hypothetical protein TWF970_004199 [Orbilia oligospora]|uniref:Asparaginase n=1 Tax=Orbilia oligospora TaxID=2813651 RepID=A0A7C8RGJ0_ORBOL|nr:hypothetical protein TWF970_004199 [Orbilia oligospora]